MHVVTVAGMGGAIMRLLQKPIPDKNPVLAKSKSLARKIEELKDEEKIRVVRSHIYTHAAPSCNIAPIAGAPQGEACAADEGASEH